MLLLCSEQFVDINPGRESGFFIFEAIDGTSNYRTCKIFIAYFLAAGKG